MIKNSKKNWRFAPSFQLLGFVGIPEVAIQNYLKKLQVSHMQYDYLDEKML